MTASTGNADGRAGPPAAPQNAVTSTQGSTPQPAGLAQLKLVAARYFPRVPLRKLQRLARNGDIPSAVKLGREWWVSQPVLERLVRGEVARG